MFSQGGCETATGNVGKPYRCLRGMAGPVTNVPRFAKIRPQKKHREHPKNPNGSKAEISALKTGDTVFSRDRLFKSPHPNLIRESIPWSISKACSQFDFCDTIDDLLLGRLDDSLRRWHSRLASVDTNDGQPAPWIKWAFCDFFGSYFGYGPFPVTGNPYNPLFATVTGKGQTHIILLMEEIRLTCWGW